MHVKTRMREQRYTSTLGLTSHPAHDHDASRSKAASGLVFLVCATSVMRLPGCLR